MVAALVRQRRRLALATLAIAIGVGYLAGALTLLDRVSEGLDDLAAAGSERADLVVEGEVAYESALEQTRRLVPSLIAGTLEDVPGVAAVVHRIEEVTLLLDDELVPLVPPGLSEQPLGSNWPEDEAMSPYRFVGEGRPPEADDEVVIDQGSAERAGVSVGDEILAVGRTQPASYTVVGVVTTDEGPLPDGASLALFTTERARAIFRMPDNDNRIAIRIEDGADPARVEAQIRAQLPPGTELVDGETAAQHRQESLTRSFALVRVLIMGFAGLALVVGMVTVSNSLTLLYAERRRALAAFRMVGAKQHQLLGAALIEAALLAAVASLLGAPLGLAFGRFIELVLGALGTSVPVGGSIISWSALGTAVLVGTAATVLAAVMPARRACRVPPVEAVVEVPAEASLSTGQRLLDSAVVGATVGVAIAGLLALFDVDGRIAAAVGAGVLVLVVVGTLLPTVLAAAVAVGISLVPLKPPPLRRIGARDAVRNRSRTAATTGALTLAVTVVAGLAVFLASFAASIDGDVDELVVSDLVIDSRTFTRGGLSAELLARTSELSGVQAVSGWQVGRGAIGQVPVRLTGIDGGSLGDVLAPGWVGEPATSFGDDGVLIEAGVAAQLGVSAGDVVPVTFQSGSVEPLTVAGVYERGSVLLGEAVVDRQLLMRQVPASVDIAGLVRLERDTPAVRDAVEDLAKSYGVTAVLEPHEFVDSRSDLLRGFERVIQWMLFFTLLQALVGVVNTLLLSVGERRREFGLLRAAGAGPRQLRRLVLAEGLSFAVIGTVLGLVLGVIGAALGIRALAAFGISGLSVPVLPLLVTALTAIGLGVAASVVPARWAAAVPPLEAVADAGMGPIRGPRGRGLVRFRFGGRRAEAPERQLRPGRGPAVAPATAPRPAFARGGPSPAGAGAMFRTGAVPAGPTGAPPPPPPSVPPERPPLFRPAADPTAPAASTPTVPTGEQGQRKESWVRPAPANGTGRGETGREERPVFARRPRSDAAVPPAPQLPAGERPHGWHPGKRPEVDPVASIRLAEVLERLDPGSVRDARPALVPLARTLEPDEHVVAMVQGWAKGLLCLVARTDRRIVVVVDRFPEPLVESLDPVATKVLLFGPPETDRMSVSVVDGRRLLEVTGVRDRAQAEALQHVAAPSTAEPTGTGYF